jgi:hypothetical protein
MEQRGFFTLLELYEPLPSIPRIRSAPEWRCEEIHMEATAKSNCRKCSRQNVHDVLFETTNKAEHPWFDELHTWQVLRCRGCETIAFRYRFDDFDDVEELSGGRTRHRTTWARYPNSVPGHKQLDGLHVAPILIRKVYEQTLTAYASGASILAGIGFRATIEAVCNQLSITGNTLEKRIDQLLKNGHISSSDRRRLHAIRFLGNDAAHEIREPKPSDLRVALDIVEHLINSVFILEHKAQSLDVPIERFEEFRLLLEKRIRDSNVDPDQSQSLTSILGRDKRRVGAELGSFEEHLAKAISIGSIKYLDLADVENADGKSVQLYKVIKAELPEDDIPF